MGSISGKNKESDAKSNFLIKYLSFYYAVTLYKIILSLNIKNYELCE